MSLKALVTGGLAVLAVAVPSTTPAFAQYQRGPNPTVASLQATTGPYATSTLSVPDSASAGFGAGNVTYPTTTADGTFGAVAIAPGFTESESAVAWLRPRLASHGFVVISFNTNSGSDQPASRGDQLLAALDWLTTTSTVKTRIDASRLRSWDTRWAAAARSRRRRTARRSRPRSASRRGTPTRRGRRSRRRR